MHIGGEKWPIQCQPRPFYSQAHIQPCCLHPSVVIIGDVSSIIYQGLAISTLRVNVITKLGLRQLVVISIGLNWLFSFFFPIHHSFVLWYGTYYSIFPYSIMLTKRWGTLMQHIGWDTMWTMQFLGLVPSTVCHLLSSNCTPGSRSYSNLVDISGRLHLHPLVPIRSVTLRGTISL